MAITWGYVAGFFDADGSGNVKSMRLSWYNTHKEVICKIRDFLASQLQINRGHLRVVEREPQINGNITGTRPMYSVSVSARKAMLPLSLELARRCIVKKHTCLAIYRKVRLLLEEKGEGRGFNLKYLIRWGTKEAARARVLKLREKGMKYREIVEATGVPRSTIGDWVTGKA